MLGPWPECTMWVQQITQLWGACDRERNDYWEAGFLSPGKDLGFYTMGNGKPFGGFNRECHYLIYVLKKRFFSVEKDLLLY